MGIRPKVYVTKRLNEQYKQDVANILYTQFGISEDEYDIKYQIRDQIGLTERGYQHLLLQVETKYDIEISDSLVDTLLDLIEQIERLVNQKKSINENPHNKKIKVLSMRK